METTLQPSFQQNIRSRIAVIEVIELTLFAFMFWGFLEMISPSASLPDGINILLGLEMIVIVSWAVYNAYIRLARAGGRRIDLALWVIGSLLTASYTFWAWTILDINRLLISKLLYRGDAPVEYAWSSPSKQVRKQWEQVRKGSV